MGAENLDSVVAGCTIGIDLLCQGGGSGACERHDRCFRDSAAFGQERGAAAIGVSRALLSNCEKPSRL
jgi:hypothetical protein